MKYLGFVICDRCVCPCPSGKVRHPVRQLRREGGGDLSLVFWCWAVNDWRDVGQLTVTR